MGRLEERSSASIEALLEVARESFGRQGYAGTSLESVAAAARMTKGAVYHHFGSKPALFEGVFRVEHRRMIDLVVAKSRAADDPIVRRILLEDGPSVLGWERWRRCEEPGFQQLIQTSLSRAAKAGMLRAGVRPAESSLLLLGAMTEGALAVAHSPAPRATARRLSDELATHVRGLCA